MRPKKHFQKKSEFFYFYIKSFLLFKNFYSSPRLNTGVKKLMFFTTKVIVLLIEFEINSPKDK